MPAVPPPRHRAAQDTVLQAIGLAGILFVLGGGLSLRTGRTLLCLRVS